MNDYNMDLLLSHRHLFWVEWGEPVPCCGPEGNDLTGNQVVRMSIHDAINAQRYIAREEGKDTMGQDAEFLQSFINVHHAHVRKP